MCGDKVVVSVEVSIKHTSLCNIFKTVTGLHFNILSYTNPSLGCLLGDLLMINGAYSETKG